MAEDKNATQWWRLQLKSLSRHRLPRPYLQAGAPSFWRHLDDPPIGNRVR